MSTYNDTAARTAVGQSFSVTLSDGATLTFTVKTSGSAATAIAAPSWTGAAVGNTAFLGITGKPVLYQTAAGTTTFAFSNISITPAPGVPAVTAYAFVAADAESTNETESLSFATNGGAWTLLDAVQPISGTVFPASSGIGTTTFTETGTPGTVGGYIVGTNSPTAVTTTLVGGGLQGAMFAVRFASLRLNKQIVGARADPTDQFKFDINATSSGTNLATGTTSGTSLGPFTAAAVSLASGIPLTITESMATGSVNTLAHYSSKLTCTNTATGSTTIVPTNVVTTSYNFGTLQFGDAVQCTFSNTPFPHLKLQKALGTGGRQFAGDQFKVDINQGATTVATATTTGAGTAVTTGVTPLYQATAGTTYTLTESAVGSTSLLQYTNAMTCTNANATSTTVLPTAVSGAITPALGDVVTCTITNTPRAANATLRVGKASSVISDPINGTTNPKMIPGAEIEYAIDVANTGPSAVDTGTIFIRDPLPGTITYNGGFPVTYAAGGVAPGLTFSTASDVRFSNAVTTPANFAACTYTPTAGYDVNVKYVCVRPTGIMAGATNAGQPSFTIRFRARIN